jgi:hypothetical protein
MSGRPPKVSHSRGRPDAYPCQFCGELTNEHVYGDRSAACDECLLERMMPWCIECGRNHHGDCASMTRPGETTADAAARFLADRELRRL